MQKQANELTSKASLNKTSASPHFCCSFLPSAMLLRVMARLLAHMYRPGSPAGPLTRQAFIIANQSCRLSSSAENSLQKSMREHMSSWHCCRKQALVCFQSRVLAYCWQQQTSIWLAVSSARYGVLLNSFLHGCSDNSLARHTAIHPKWYQQ